LMNEVGKGKRYKATVVGRYGASKGTSDAERGLFQLKPHYWGDKCGLKPRELFMPFVNIKCAVLGVRQMQDKAIGKGHRMRHRRAAAKVIRSGWDWAGRFSFHSKDPETLEDFLSISRGKRADWRAHYRCTQRIRSMGACMRHVPTCRKQLKAFKRATRAVKKGKLKGPVPAPDLRCTSVSLKCTAAVKRCDRAVGRVKRYQRSLHNTYAARHTVKFWSLVAVKVGPLLVRSLGTGWRHRGDDEALEKIAKKIRKQGLDRGPDEETAQVTPQR
jgi:hypothetical protein